MGGVIGPSELVSPAFVGPYYDGPDFVGPAFVVPDYDGPDYDGPAFVVPDYDGPDFVGLPSDRGCFALCALQTQGHVFLVVHTTVMKTCVHFNTRSQTSK